MPKKAGLLTFLVIVLFSVSAAAAVTKLEVVTVDDLLTKWYNTEGEKFHKQNPDIVVEARTVPGSLTGISDHITLRLAAGDPPVGSAYSAA